MRHEIGDEVVLNQDLAFEDGKTIVAGTRGVVRDRYTIFEAYLVKFEGVGLPRMVHESALDPA